MSAINSISEFLNHAGCQFQVYDMGRVIRRIDTQDFIDIEYNKMPYPYPIQRQAIFTVIFWNPSLSKQHYIWFLKLPLDENSLLVTAARNDFLEIVVNALGSAMEQLEDSEQQLPECNYVFQPNTQKRASIHSKLRQQFEQGYSEYYPAALSFLNGQSKDWQSIGVQGLADICNSLNENNHLEMLNATIGHLPTPVYNAICQLLENNAIPQSLSHQLLAQLEQAIAALDGNTLVHTVRALAQASEKLQQKAVKLILELNIPEEQQKELMIMIAGRLWLALTEDKIRKEFFEQLAMIKDQTFFNQIFADLVAIPALRTQILSILRDSDRTESLSAAIGELFKAHNATS